MSDQTLRKLMDDICRKHGHRAAVLSENQPSRSFSQLHQLHQQLDNVLTSFNLATPSAIAVLLPQSPQTALLCLGLMRHHHCIPLNPAATKYELEQQLSPLQPALLITDQTLQTKLVPGSPLDAIPRSLLEARAGPCGEFMLQPPTQIPRPSPPALRRDTSLVLHTSGSTGTAKAVELSHTMLLSAIRRTAASLQLSRDDCALNLLPLFHIGGLMDVLLAPLSVGSKVYLSAKQDRQSVRSLLRTQRISWLQGVPTMLLEYGRRETFEPPEHFPALRLVRSVSAPLLPAQFEQLRQGFGVPVVEIYGMTETCGLICSNSILDGEQIAASVGRPVESEICVADSRGNPVPAGVPGEVLIRGEHVFAGYHRGHSGSDIMPAEEFIGNWFRSGDQGYIDEEGRLFLTGRIKELINRGGEKFSPLEIETCLQAAQGIREAACFALPHPSLGEEAALAIVSTKNIDDETVRQVLEEQLAPHKIPRHIFRLNKLPKNASGKIQRHRLTEQFGATPTARKTTPSLELGPLGRQILPLWQRALGQPDANRASTVTRTYYEEDFFDLGGDSLKAATFMASLSELLGVTANPALLYDNPTLVDLERALLAELPDDCLIGHPATSSEFPEAMLRTLLGFLAGWQGKRNSPQSLLVGLNTLGSQTPLFWGCQSYDEFTQCAAQFPSNQPVYGFRSLFKVPHKNTRSNRALARYYCDELQQIQPAGPYILGGYCEGASFAFYIAEELRCRGEEVRLLLAVERFIPEPYSGRLCYIFSEGSSHSPFRRFRNPETLWHSLYSGEVSCIRRNWKHKSFMSSPQIEELGELMRSEISAAQRGVPSPFIIPPQQHRPMQAPSPRARRASINTVLPPSLSPGQKVCLQVSLNNISEEIWPSGERSGLHLYARWRSTRSGHVRQWKAGVERINKEIKAGEQTTLPLTLSAPSRMGRWQLELDLACEGLFFFEESGSAICRLNCLVIYGGQHFSRLSPQPPAAIQEL